MGNKAVLIGLAGLMVVSLALALGIWVLHVRDYMARRERRSTASRSTPPPVQHFLGALRLAVDHQQAPWFVRLFAVLIFVGAAAFLLGLLLAKVGLR